MKSLLIGLGLSLAIVSPALAQGGCGDGNCGVGSYAGHGQGGHTESSIQTHHSIESSRSGGTSPQSYGGGRIDSDFSDVGGSSSSTIVGGEGKGGGGGKTTTTCSGDAC